MKIAESTVKKLTITGVENLDPVAVIVEDFGPGAGKITITCFGDAWSYYWSHMGEKTKLAEFFCKCDEHYLAKKLSSGIKSHVTTDEGLEDHLKSKIIEQRRDGDIDKDRARELWDLAKHTELHDRDNLYVILGDEWWHQLPEEPNPDYGYLCRIISTVQAAFKQQVEQV